MKKLRRILKVIKKGIGELKKELLRENINKGSITAGRPKKENKKAQVNVKLPPWLNEWMKRQPESKAVLIETALVSYYQIPKGVQERKK
jgi:hypothetical protein